MAIRILTPKSTYTVDYPQAIEFSKKQTEIFWLPDEVEVEKDLHELKTNFTDSEYHGVISTLKLFTLYELNVGNDYWQNYVQKYFQGQIYKEWLQPLRFLKLRSMLLSIVKLMNCLV